MNIIPSSELIINNDGSVFHLHLRPEQLADNVILVGDQNRVNLIASYFDTVECEVQNREFHTITGTFQGKRISAISTGIGTDNIDIVLTELDALANVNFQTRTINEKHRSLSIVRIGTCGALQPNIPLGSFLASKRSIGLDGVIHFYKSGESVCDDDFQKAFVKATNWSEKKATPYVVNNNDELLQNIAIKNNMICGVTISANGFYGPQGRIIRLQLDDNDINKKIETFTYGEEKICNYEMESSAIAGLSKLLGHRALTVCCVIANRHAKTANVDYKTRMSELIQTVLKSI